MAKSTKKRKKRQLQSVLQTNSSAGLEHSADAVNAVKAK